MKLKLNKRMKMKMKKQFNLSKQLGKNNIFIGSKHKWDNLLLGKMQGNSPLLKKRLAPA